MTVKADYALGQRPTVADFNTFAANPALKYITTVNINAVTTTVSNVFSSTYDNYRLEWSSTYSPTALTYPLISFTGGAGTAHFDGLKYTSATTGVVTTNFQSGSGYWLTAAIDSTSVDTSHIVMDIYNPFNTVDTTYSSKFNTVKGGGFAGGMVKSATSYTGFTITGVFSSTIVGTLRIYGYRKPTEYNNAGFIYNEPITYG